MFVYLQNLGCTEDAVNAILMQIGFAAVHELQQYLQVIGARAVQDDEQLIVCRRVDRRMAEQALEVGAARGQDEPVGLEGLT